MENSGLLTANQNQGNNEGSLSSLSLSNSLRIDERPIAVQNRIDNIYDHKWIKFHSQSDLRRFYVEINSRPIIEREITPGTITPLIFARQLRDLQIEESFNEVKRSGTTYLLTGTTGARLSEWSNWIYSIREEAYTDLYNQRQPQLEYENENLSQHHQMQREQTPDDQRSFVDNNHIDPVIIKYTIETTEPSIHENGMDDTAHTYSPANENRTEDEQSEENLFIESRLPSPTQSTYEISNNYDTSGSLLVHSRARNFSLAKLHETVKLPVIFTDLFLNLLNRLHNEYQSLLKTFKSITKFERFNDDDNLRVFKMLLLYARSTQPPFRYSTHKIDTPVLHLELFFDPLISEDRIIHDVRFDLKYYIENTILNADRYSAFINNVLNVRLKLFKIQGIQTFET